MPTTNQPLNPCPFCGDEGINVIDGYELTHKCRLAGVRDITIRTSVWNNRPEEARLREEIAELTKEIETELRPHLKAGLAEIARLKTENEQLKLKASQDDMAMRMMQASMDHVMNEPHPTCETCENYKCGYSNKRKCIWGYSVNYCSAHTALKGEDDG